MRPASPASNRRPADVSGTDATFGARATFGAFVYLDDVLVAGEDAAQLFDVRSAFPDSDPRPTDASGDDVPGAEEASTGAEGAASIPPPPSAPVLTTPAGRALYTGGNVHPTSRRHVSAPTHPTSLVTTFPRSNNNIETNEPTQPPGPDRRPRLRL